MGGPGLAGGEALRRGVVSMFGGMLMLMGLASAAGAVAIEVQRATLPNTFNDVNFQRIDFVSDVFSSAGITPVVLTIPTTRGGDACAIRIRTVDSTGFEAACVETPGYDGLHLDMDLHYIAIEPGVHSIPATVGGVATTVTFAAGSTSTSAVQHNCPPTCGATGSTPVAFGTTFSTPPSLLLQIQTLASESGTPPSTPSMPFLVATTIDVAGSPSITTTGFDVALERSEVAAGTVSPEVVGWLAAAPTAGCTLLDFSSFGGPASVPFEAFVTGLVVDGIADGCNAGEGVSFSGGCFASPPVVVGTKRSRLGGDGGWLRRCTNGFGTGAARFTVDEDIASDPERNHGDESISVFAFDTDFSTPVDLAFVARESTSETHWLRFSTATESGAIAFRVEAQVAATRADRSRTAGMSTSSAWQPIGEDWIRAKAVDGTRPQHYAVDVGDVGDRALRLIEIDRFGRQTVHGPFAPGARRGVRPAPSPIDWPSIRLETRRLTDARLRAKSASGVEAVEALVSETGVVRIAHEALAEAGLDLRGVRARHIALMVGQAGIPRRLLGVDAAGRWTEDGVVEFWGQAVEDSLYTRTRVYRVAIDVARAIPMPVDSRRALDLPPRTDDLARVVDAEDRAYSFGSPNGDPWYRNALLAFGTPRILEIPMPIDHLVVEPGGASPRLIVDLWGVTDFPTAPDHHVIVALNGQPVADEVFDGLRQRIVDVPLDADVLREGENVVSVTLPADLGVPFDLVHIESATLVHRRAFVARDDRHSFTSSGKVLEVDGFSHDDIVAYRVHDDRPTRLSVVTRPTARGVAARVRGRVARERRFEIATVDRLPTVDEIRPATQPAALAGDAEYLIVSHPHFVEALAPLIALRQDGGRAVQVVDTESIYAAWSDGVVDPQAIRRFIADAVSQHGTRMVLLVGADTYDYFDRTGTGAKSFVPTIYAQTDDIVRFAPVDALLADVDDDGDGDLPIGRLPVRTIGELEQVIAKIIAHEQSGPLPHAVMVADGLEPMASFGRFSDQLADRLAVDWTSERIHLDALSVDEAHARLLSALEAGPGLVSFVGHSSTGRWTFDGLFDVGDVDALTNRTSPIVLQGGCWNTYFVEPQAETLAQALLLGPHGAVAVVGPSVLSRFGSEQKIEAPLLDGLMQGMTIGEALQAAKEALGPEGAIRRDALLGWTLLGDPALGIQAPR